jgi:hypothetical protein
MTVWYRLLAVGLMFLVLAGLAILYLRSRGPM